MRSRRLGWGLFLALAFLFTLVALLPLRLALDWLGFDARGLTARAATGSVWFGALEQAQVGPVPLGDLTARLNVLPLFLGRARVSLRSGEEGTFAGAVTATRHGFGFDDVNARLRVGALLAPAGVGMLDFDDVGAAFAGGRCTRGEGRVRAAVTGQVAGLGLAGGLSGTARCAGDALLLPLASQPGLERLNIRLFGDGRYQVEWLVRPTDEATRGRLVAAGFRPAGQGYFMQVGGAF
jgi:general secretion pathway protein N